MITIIAGPNESGVRLDRIIRKKLSLMSLSTIYGLIRRGWQGKTGETPDDSSAWSGPICSNAIL